ncbi:hypothetical protein [Natronosalvus rutilus]|uniref:Uncharacterized protein n=1 Tax=Natronosalvus rutilus TaxID=2953753 RepID=A0A9E7SZ23_9EURY|nr:hypothetical protein [Natronosalvus rutilus]UTF55603.1 hypothetical protein NGM29_19570 [Natronosalvus rutilus]
MASDGELMLEIVEALEEEGLKHMMRIGGMRDRRRSARESCRLSEHRR